MSESAYTFFVPDRIGKLRNLNLLVRSAVEGFISGLHRSPHHGFSVEFSEHREYTPGDEPRMIDWKAVARTEKYYVRRFEMESNMNVVPAATGLVESTDVTTLPSASTICEVSLTSTLAAVSF